MKVQLPVRAAILNRRTYETPSEGRANKVRLDFNENTSGCSPAVKRALAKLTTKQIAMYPEYQRGTERLALHFGVSADELLLTNGGDEALRVFFDAFVNSDENVLFCEPTFPMYRYFAEIAGAKIEALRYGPEMEFPLEEVLLALRANPRVLFIANPNNPTGTLVPREDIETILQSAAQTAVVIDEAYAEFSGMSLVPYIGEYPQLFLTRTFSKTAGLAGLRLGAVIARAESLAILRRAMPPYPVNLAALSGAVAAAQDSRAMRAYVKEVIRLRAWLAQELQKLGVKTYPSGGNFLLVEFGSQGPALVQRLERAGVLLRDRSKDMGPGFVRISIGTAREMNLLLRNIKRYGEF